MPDKNESERRKQILRDLKLKAQEEFDKRVAASNEDLPGDDNNKTQFFGGSDVSLDETERCETYLRAQCVDRATAKLFYSYLRLSFGDDDLLKDGKLFIDNIEQTKGHNLKEMKFDKAIGKLRYRDFNPHKLYNLIADEHGIHQIGGSPAPGLKMPDNDCEVPFQYIGYLDNKDEAFEWLPFKLHLVCPIYLNIDNLFLDYADPMRPIIINKDEVEAADCSYEELNKETNVVYKKVRFRASPAIHTDCELGLAGVAKWIQYPEFPVCPKTNKTMKFVCQLRSNAGVEVEESNIIASSDHMESYFTEMNFWADGNLFVFFEPTSHVACYFIQHT